ncbi:MAG: hypothetical protein Q9207_007485 [Kuettlingeria erythrocarpa]
MYRVRIEKHNIEIQKLRLEIAMQRYQHIRTRTTTDEGAAGQSVTHRGNLRASQQKPTVQSALRHEKNEDNATNRELGVSFAQSRLERDRRSDGAKQKAHETVNTSSVNPKKNARQRSEIAGGSGSPEAANELHRLEDIEQHPLQTQPPDDTTGHVSTERALLRPTEEDLSGKSSDPGQARAQPLGNGHTSSTRSAQGATSKAPSEHNNASGSDHDGESNWHYLSSSSTDQQSPLEEEPGEDANASAFLDGGSLNQANALSDRDDLTRSSVSDSESDMVVIAHSPQVDVGPMTAEVNIEEGHASFPFQSPIPTSVGGYRSESLDGPKPDAVQPDASIHPKQDSVGTSEGAIPANRMKYFIGVQFFIPRLISTMLRKTQFAGKSNLNHWRRKTSETTPQSAHDQGFSQPQPPPPVQTSDGRYPSTLSPQPLQYSLPSEGPPYENRNVRDQLNYALWPRYFPAQDTHALHEMWHFRPYGALKVMHHRRSL